MGISDESDVTEQPFSPPIFRLVDGWGESWMIGHPTFVRKTGYLIHDQWLATRGFVDSSPSSSNLPHNQ